MPKFEYQVRDARGGTATGTLSAADVGEASRLLRSEGHVIVDLHEHRGSAPSAAPAIVPGKVRVKHDEVIFFANQLAVMVDTGVPLADAIDSITENSRDERFKAVIGGVSEQVKSGVEFSASLRQYPRVFDRLFVAMVKASEASGTLGTMLQRVSKHLEAQRAIRRRVKGAMAYPMAMLGFCVLVVVAMLLFVLPRFAKIYEGKSAALPVPTRLLLGLSQGIIDHYLIILAVLVAVGAGIYVLMTRPEGKVMWDRARLRLPVLGPMYRKACLSRSLRTLATMVATGVSMLESLEIAAEVSGNVEFDGIWRQLQDRLKEGASLSEEMRQFPLMPAPVCQMVSAGERTGKLGPVLDRVATFCEEDLDTAIRTATSFIEPAMIVIMGLIVGGIAMALLLPVFSLSKVVAS
ncbi:MAG TPA: type II secretion system F family protein [Phycisphaerae bacterium]|nr:type II secretion system F family protein [Phycisphaerae bacterium]